jgi:hypothetical protein
MGKYTYIYVVRIDKFRYEIQEQEELPLWYTGVHRPISSAGVAKKSWVKKRK